MKKNFIIFGIAFLFAVSLVFAGITSYVLKEGESLGKAKIDAVLKDKVVIGEKVYSKGEIFYEDGKAYRVKEIKPKSWFFGSDEVEIEEVEEGRPEANSEREAIPVIEDSNNSWAESNDSFQGNFTPRIFDVPVLFARGLTSSQVNVKGELNTQRIYLRNLLTFGTKGAAYNLGIAKNKALFFYPHSDGLEGNFFFLGDLVASGNLKSRDLIVKDEAEIADLQVGNLKGRGKAYVCVESNGILYRSKAPCV
jgi:hypothetical protein